MGTKQEIEEWLKKDYPITAIEFDNKKCQGLNDIIFIINKALDHFKPKPVTSEEKLKELVENAFGKEAGKDEDLIYLYGECLKYALEEIVNQTVIRDSEIKDPSEYHKEWIKTYSYKDIGLDAAHLWNFANDYAEYTRSKQTEPKDNWIKCSERLPVEDNIVMMYNGNHIALGWYSKDHKIEPDNTITSLPRVWKYSNSALDWKITHWQPLPSKPKDN